MSSNSYYLMITFWGERFREQFYSLCLSSLLSPRNLPVLRDFPGSKFIISTTKDDWEALQERPLFEQLRNYVEPVFIDIGYPDDNNSLPASVTGRHRIMLHMSTGHRMAARRALADRVWAGFVAPDLLISDGTIAFVTEKAKLGYRAVLAPVFRYAEELVMPSLRSEGFLRADVPMVLKPRYLAGLAQRSLHSEIRMYEFDAPYFGDYPLWCYWRVPEHDAIVIHSMSWGLLLGDFAKVPDYNDDVLDNDTTDGKYIYSTFYQGGNKEDLYFSDDSDQVFYLSLTPESELTYLPFRDRKINTSVCGVENRIYSINKYLFSEQCDEFRRFAYCIPCHIHGGDLTLASANTALKSKKIVNSALELGKIAKKAQELYVREQDRKLVDLKRYPQTPLGQCMLIVYVAIQNPWADIAILLANFKRRIFRSLFGPWIGSVLCRTEHRQRERVLTLVPSAYQCAVRSRVRVYQASNPTLRTSSLLQALFLEFEWRILGCVFRWLTGPVLIRMNRSRLLFLLKFVPKRHLRRFIGRIRKYRGQARQLNCGDSLLQKAS